MERGGLRTWESGNKEWMKSDVWAGLCPENKHKHTPHTYTLHTHAHYTHMHTTQTFTPHTKAHMRRYRLLGNTGLWNRDQSKFPIPMS